MKILRENQTQIQETHTTSSLIYCKTEKYRQNRQREVGRDREKCDDHYR